MWNVSGALGKLFFVAGFIPAVTFLAAVDLVLMPRLAGGRHLIEVAFLDIPGVVYILGGTFIGLLLMALNTAVIKLYEHGFFLAGWLRRRNQERRAQRYTALLARREAFEEAQEDGLDLSQPIARLESVHERLEAMEPSQSLPHEDRYVMPTALGNAFAVMEEYPYERYGMDAMIFWPRLSAVIPEDYKSLIGDLKTGLDFLLNLSLLALLFGLAAVGVGVWFRAPLVGLAAILSAIVAYGLYRQAVGATRELGEVVTSCFDLFRGQLLAQLGLEPPESLLAERRTWLLLASYIRRGETFYYPLTQTMEDDRALLQQTLSRHTHNLYKLRSKAAFYGAGEVPLYLMNQIEAEEQAIAEIRSRLAIPESSP